MNIYIKHIDKLSFSVWENLRISFVQLLILFVITAFVALWIFTKNTKNITIILISVILFFVLRDIDIIQHKIQQKLIVYNVPKQKAVDFIAGNSCRFSGDSIVIKDALLRSYNIKPGHIKNRLHASEEMILPRIENYILKVNAVKILVLNKNIFQGSAPKKNKT